MGKTEGLQVGRVPGASEQPKKTRQHVITAELESTTETYLHHCQRWRATSRSQIRTGSPFFQLGSTAMSCWQETQRGWHHRLNKPAAGVIETEEKHMVSRRLVKEIEPKGKREASPRTKNRQQAGRPYLTRHWHWLHWDRRLSSGRRRGRISLSTGRYRTGKRPTRGRTSRPPPCFVVLASKLEIKRLQAPSQRRLLHNVAALA